MTSNKNLGLFLSALDGEITTPPPVWLMRQAGRYLPEYQATRRRAGSFWTMCMTPSLAVQVTLQPIDRFDLDAAILFSDILVVPFAMGQQVTFEDGIGPRLAPYPGIDGLDLNEDHWLARLAPVYEAVATTRAKLEKSKAMIGFAGAPWTLAAYMMEGQGSPDQRKAKLFGYGAPAEFARLLDRLADAVSWHLLRQIEAGADVVQIFDSWAGGLTKTQFRDWCIAPTKRIVANVRQQRPNARIIGFPRATSQEGYTAYLETGVDAIGIDTGTSIGWAAKTLAGKIAIQGNLDPIALIAGGDALDSAVDHILGATKGARLIFNLGHGVLPQTPPDNVARVVSRLRGSRA